MTEKNKFTHLPQDIRQIHFGNLKRLGHIKAIGFDKDNCLTAPYVSTIHPPFRVI